MWWVSIKTGLRSHSRPCRIHVSKVWLYGTFTYNPTHRPSTLLPYPPTPPRLPMKTKIHIGALYTHKLHGGTSMVTGFFRGSLGDPRVRILYFDTMYHTDIPTDVIHRWYLPIGDTHEWLAYRFTVEVSTKCRHSPNPRSMRCVRRLQRIHDYLSCPNTGLYSEYTCVRRWMDIWVGIALHMTHEQHFAALAHNAYAHNAPAAIFDCPLEKNFT